MKISPIIALLALAPAVLADPCVTDGIDRATCDPADDNGGCLTNHGCTANEAARIDFSQFGSWEELFSFDGMTLPTLEDLNAFYDGFCQLCDAASLLNLDQQFCFLCTLDLDGDGDAGETVGDLIGGFVPDVSCFSEVSTVQTPHGTITMKNLQVGDRVLTANGAFEPVYAWGHKHATQKAEFLQFNGDLEMTGAHLVFLEGKTNPVRADSVNVGDVLQGATVKSIKTVKRQGVYTPLTPSGTVVVNGIAASSYVSLQENAKEYVAMQGGFAIISIHDFIHMAMSPFRMFTMGVSSSVSYTEEGVPTFAAAGIDLAQWADNQNILVQAVLFVVFLAVTGTSMMLENTFGPSMAPLAVAAGAGAYALMKRNNISIRAQKIKSV
ncbi:Protein hedgehog [Seminavis robusta]|uniref:Protein hedgehog n=1 Tax=Seminavis robusta TaxID=568900 RepID=A0A9N8E5L5_9STRA|nr:Protein hedgehog [Seminavis robusta]|eukprot:Sro676_g185670.1 Protein hedgehog (382) ;mRNA; f:29530-30675